MASLWFIKLAFKCFHHIAWPLVALVYPLCATIKANETDSFAETKNLISYWILLSMIYFFEYAFMSLLQWFHVWPYIKLVVIFLLIIPDFGRASYVYYNLTRFMKPKIVTWRLNNCWRKCFVEKDNFLMHVERYMKENGTEALEKLIASKNKMCRTDAEVINEMVATDNNEMIKTNEETLQIEHKDIKDLVAVEKNEIPATKQVVPQSEVQKLWTCSLCLVKTWSNRTWVSHLKGRKHRAACIVAFKADKKPALQDNLYEEPFRMINSEIICMACNIVLYEEYMFSHLMGRKHLSKLQICKLL